MAHATVRTSEPMSQGFAALMEPFLDTVVICLLTALVVVVSGVYQTSPSEGIALTSDAFATVVPWFPVVLAVVAILFALSTVLSWGYYGEQAWTWLFSEHQASRVAYRLFLCCGVVGGRDARRSRQVVNIVDSLNFCMAIPNLIAVYLLLPELRADLASYWQRVVLKNGPEKTMCRVRPTCGRWPSCTRCGGWSWPSTRYDRSDWLLENVLVFAGGRRCWSSRTSHFRCRASRTPASSCS